MWVPRHEGRTDFHDTNNFLLLLSYQNQEKKCGTEEYKPYMLSCTLSNEHVLLFFFFFSEFCHTLE